MSPADAWMLPPFQRRSFLHHWSGAARCVLQPQAVTSPAFSPEHRRRAETPSIENSREPKKNRRHRIRSGVFPPAVSVAAK